MEAVKWETDLESGSYDKKRIQDEINPLLDDCRVAFVLFYSNVGKFTLQEYRLAEEKNKKIFLYFKKGFSPKTKKENTNYGNVLQLKETIEKENRTLYVEYETIDQFENQVRQDLNLYISRNYSPDQREKNTEYNEYLANLQRSGANLEAATSEALFKKTPDHLDKKQLTDFFQQERVKAEFTGENLDTPGEKLGYLHLLSGKNNLIKGTFLCLGKNIHEVCRTASPSQFFVFEDTERLKPLIPEMVRGNLITQYLKMLLHLRKNLYLVRDIYNDRKEDYEIPRIVFQELLANAFVHRDYSQDVLANIQVELYPDRLEIKNPGIFPDALDLTKINENELSLPRNPEIAGVFFLYKFIEKAGSGIKRIQKILKANGFKPAVFFQDKKINYVKVTVYKKRTPVTVTAPSLLTHLPVRKIDMIGRQEELRYLEERLNKTDRPLLVNGMGGIGKTELCIRFFMDHYRQYAYAGWIDYVSSIKESIVNNIHTDLVRLEEENTLDQRFYKIMNFLEQLGADALLVIDNIENPDDQDLDKLLRLPPNVKIIVNSRLALKGLETLVLDSLSTEACKKLFYTYYEGEKDDASVEKIIDRCGRHTLTVELLARTAQSAAFPLKSLYEKLVQEGFNLNESIHDKVHTFWHHGKEKKRFFDHLLTLFDLSGLTENELYLLTNLSVLPPIHISINDFSQWMELETKDDIHSLAVKGWLRRDGFDIVIHQVVQEVIRYRTKPSSTACEHLIGSLIDELYLEPGENPLNKKKFIIFAESLLHHIEERNRDLATLSNNLSAIHKTLGHWEKALYFQLKAGKIFENILDKNHPDLAASYNNLSTIYKEMGNLEKALEFQWKDVKISEQTLDKNHPDLAASYNNLSSIYQAMGDLEKASEFQWKALTIREQVLDKYHPDLATSYNNLSSIYQAMGDLEKALEFQMKTVEIVEQVLDKNHPSLATSYNNLSQIYQAMGHLEKALEFQIKDVEISEQVLDENHPSLATSYNNLAMIYHAMTDYPRAIAYGEKAVGILQHLFPNGHPHLDKAKRNLERIKQEK